MLERRSGHIVFVTSMAAKKGLPPDAPYVAAKFAMSGFGEVLRQELHGTGISVSTIFPGRVDTPMIANLRVPWISAKIPPERVAQAIVGPSGGRQKHLPADPVFTYRQCTSPWLITVFSAPGAGIETRIMHNENIPLSAQFENSHDWLRLPVGGLYPRAASF
jgi:hypothetical protein